MPNDSKFQPWLECRSLSLLACKIKPLSLPCHLLQRYRHASGLRRVPTHEWERLGKHEFLLPQQVCNFRWHYKHFQCWPIPGQNNHLTSFQFPYRDPAQSSKWPHPRFCSTNKIRNYVKLHLNILLFTQNRLNPNI